MLPLVIFGQLARFTLWPALASTNNTAQRSRGFRMTDRLSFAGATPRAMSENLIFLLSSAQMAHQQELLRRTASVPVLNISLSAPFLNG